MLLYICLTLLAYFLYLSCSLVAPFLPVFHIFVACLLVVHFSCTFLLLSWTCSHSFCTFLVLAVQSSGLNSVLTHSQYFFATFLRDVMCSVWCLQFGGSGIDLGTITTFPPAREYAGTGVETRNSFEIERVRTPTAAKPWNYNDQKESI